MTPIRVRRIAAATTSALLAVGLVLPTATTALADEPPVDDTTTTVVDPPVEQPAVAEPEQPEPDAEEIAEQSAPDAAPAPEVPVAAPAPAVASTPEAAPALTAATPSAPATLRAADTLAPGETLTTTVAVDAAEEYVLVVLGNQLDGSLTLPGGASYRLYEFGRTWRASTPALAPATGEVTIRIRNDSSEAQEVVYAFAFQRTGVDLNMSTGIGGEDLTAHVGPSIGGIGRADLTGEMRAIGRGGVTATAAMTPQVPGSTAYHASIAGLPAGMYLVEVVMTVDGVAHSWIISTHTHPAETTPPVVGYTTEPAASNANGWFRRAVTVTLGASDTGTGVWRIHRAVAPAALEPVYTSRTELALTTEGAHTVRYYAEDYQQNASSVTERLVRIDLTGPTLDLGGFEDGQVFEHGEEATVAYTCDDALSGISTCTGTIPDGDLLDTTTVGDHEVTVVAVDRAGNETRETRGYTVVSADTTAPELDIDLPEPSAHGWFDRGVVVRFAARDSESGIGLIRWEYGTPSGVIVGSSTDAEAELALERTGSYELRVWAEDAAGNRSATLTRTVRIDLDAPTVDIAVPIAARPPLAASAALPPGQVRQGQAVRVAFTCDDAASGIDTCTGSTADGAMLPTDRVGTHEFRVVATDLAGNRTEQLVSYTVLAAPAASETPRLARTGAETLIPGIALVALLLAAGALLLASRRLGGR